MRRNEAEYESDTHACQGERAVDAVCTHHLRIVIVDPKERVEEQIAGDQRDDGGIDVIGGWLFMNGRQCFRIEGRRES